MFEQNKSCFRRSVWNFDLNLWILRACRHQIRGQLAILINDLEALVKISWKQQVHELRIIKVLVRKTYVVSRVAPVIAKGAKDILREIFGRRNVVPQLRVMVTFLWVVFLICSFLLGKVVKPLPVKGQTGAFKPSITFSNLVLSFAFVCRSVQTLDNFVSEFTLLTRKCE